MIIDLLIDLVVLFFFLVGCAVILIGASFIVWFVIGFSQAAARDVRRWYGWRRHEQYIDDYHAHMFDRPRGASATTDDHHERRPRT